jgi:hypothetical protein
MRYETHNSAAAHRAAMRCSKEPSYSITSSASSSNDSEMVNPSA